MEGCGHDLVVRLLVERADAGFQQHALGRAQEDAVSLFTAQEDADNAMYQMKRMMKGGRE